MFTLTSPLTAAHEQFVSGVVTVSDKDQGGYDVLLGGLGFRLATDTQNSYKRYTEDVSANRFDNSNEPGEQSLTAVPWRKSQASFHGGAGQLNSEQALSSFQYQEAQLAHLRYQISQGVDPWTPGVVSRLPDTMFTNYGFTPTCMATATVAGIDYAILGGPGCLQQFAWLSGPDAAPTITAIAPANSAWGAGGFSGNATVTDITSDGTNYYAAVTLTAANGSGNVSLLVNGSATSSAMPNVAVTDTVTWRSTVGWVKDRLMLGVNNKLYEVPASQFTTGAALSTMTAALKYTHPVSTWTWTAISESPTAIIAAGQNGGISTLTAFTLDTSGVAPVLAGGATVAEMPLGELICSLQAVLGAELAIGTNLGVRIATFDTYNGALKYGPLSVSTTAPVYSLASRDRFVFAGYTNQQPDGKTGLVRLDISQPVDSAGRSAYAPDLRPPSTAPTGLGTVWAVSALPSSTRLVFITSEGIHVEGSGPGSDGAAWLKTSRIRFDTTTPKLFKMGRIHGELQSGSVAITASTPDNPDVSAGVIGFTLTSDPGEFRLPGGLHEWMQLTFTLIGSSAQLNSYQLSALPAPFKQHLIELSLNCYQHESDYLGQRVEDPTDPRTRYAAIQELDATGNEFRFTEFTNLGPIAEIVRVEKQQFVQTSRRSRENDFGGVISLVLRSTEAA